MAHAIAKEHTSAICGGPSLMRTINRESGFPSVEEARRRLLAEMDAARQSGIRLLKVIHGWGSSGEGGKLAPAIRRSLRLRVREGRAALVVPGRMLTRSLVFGDRAVVDGAVSGIAKSTVAVGDAARKVQTGHVRSYAATMTLGVVVLAVVVLILGS